MRKKDINFTTSFIILIILVYTTKGFAGVVDYIKDIGNFYWQIIVMANKANIELTGDSLLVLLFKSSITFIIVGLILEFFNISKGTFGKIFGKAAFWLIGFPVTLILNFLSKIIFKY